MEYRVLGPLEVRDGDRSLPLAGAKQRALLALLLVHANHVVSRDRLIDELWGDQPPETAVTTLQVYVSRLRKVLPPQTLHTRAPGYLLEVEPDDLDLHRFQRLLVEGREACAAGEAERAAQLLHAALALWRGAALAEFAFEPFAQAEIGRLEELRLAAVEERIDADLALGRHADLIGELEALIAENPHRERLRGQLMLALYRSGRQAEALAAYQEARRALVDELGIEPSADLQRLEKQILTQDEGLVTPQMTGPVAARAPRPVERKNVTVLFADLGMADETEADPEEAGALLDRIHDEAAAEIEAAGGTVEKGLAGALLATFGAESARQEDHAVRAVSAALATRRRLTSVFGDALSLRMGVASGEVILGRPGSFVTGTPVASAARLVRFAQPGEVVVGERTATATAGAFQLQQRNGAYVLVGALAPTFSPAQVARRRKRRRLLALAGATLAAAAIGLAAVYTTRPGVVTVPPNAVGIIEPKTNKVVGYVAVGPRPEGVAVGQGPNAPVWVANLDDKSLMRIDPAKRKVVRRISLEAQGTPDDLVVGFGAVWVAHGILGTVSRVAPQYTGIKTIRPPFTRHVGGGGTHGSITIGAKSVWVAFGDSSVSRIDPKSLHVVATTLAGNSPSAIAYGSRSVWVANVSDSRVARINTLTNAPFSLPITVGRSPNGIATGGGAVWVTSMGDDTVTRIDPDSGSTRSVSVGIAPFGIAYAPGAVWVANSGDGTISRIDLETLKVVKTIHVGNSPRRIAYGAGKLWVTVQAVT
ncbi:MAG: BTAD domain-containing putative transcriptional regulator [Gaiellaceae bacterium]|jgi:YVTN family beta-propeller protein